MPWSTKRKQFRVCAQCGKDFPAHHLNLRIAKRDGKDEFCDENCRSVYLDGTTMPVINGHKFTPNRRVH